MSDGVRPVSGGGLSRRDLLRLGGAGGVVLASSGWLAACVAPPGPPVDPTSTTTTTTTPPFTGYGALGAADANGLRLPAGFTSRVVATTGEAVGSTSYTWPADPDGGATFATEDGGWIYVANAESFAPNGGASMIRFGSDGTITHAQRILSGTNRNCAGGATPWGTWLSCEEFAGGRVWECDPTGANAAVVRPLLGTFSHEAVAVDPVGQALYLTEDVPDGALYRFRPTAYPDLATGTLEVLTESGGTLAWVAVPDPSASSTATRNQVADTKRFNGGEGICWFDDSVYFTTKGDNVVRRYTPSTNALVEVYRAGSGAVLTGVDNITTNQAGDLFVAEDGGDMQIVMVRGTTVEAVAQVTGVSGSEMTGPAFSPDGSRLYFSSQRNPGRTYEVTGPWQHL